MSSRVVRAEAGLNHAESHFVRTRYGVEFDARERWWLIDGKRGIDVESLRSLVAPSLRPGLVATLRYAAQKYSWSTLAQYRAALKSFQKECFPSRDCGVDDRGHPAVPREAHRRVRLRGLSVPLEVATGEVAQRPAAGRY
jgi:hypothetical protein